MRTETFKAVRAMLESEQLAPEQAVALLGRIQPQAASAAESATSDCLLTKREVADLFKVTTRTVEMWSASGKLTRLKHGRRCVRFLRSQIMDALTSVAVPHG